MRIRIPYELPEWFSNKYLDRKLYSGQLILKNDSVILYVTFQLPPPCGGGSWIESIHHQKILQFDVFNCWCWVIKFIISNQNFFLKVVKMFECWKFTLVCGIISNRICNLDIVFLAIFASKEIDFFSIICCIDLEIISTVNKFIIDYIFQIMSNIKSLICMEEGVECNVSIVNFPIIL